MRGYCILYIVLLHNVIWTSGAHIAARMSAVKYIDRSKTSSIMSQEEYNNIFSCVYEIKISIF